MLDASVSESTETNTSCTSIETEAIAEEEDGEQNMQQDIGVQVYISKRNARVQAKPKISSKGKHTSVQLLIEL